MNQDHKPLLAATGLALLLFLILILWLLPLQVIPVDADAGDDLRLRSADKNITLELASEAESEKTSEAADRSGQVSNPIAKQAIPPPPPPSKVGGLNISGGEGLYLAFVLDECKGVSDGHVVFEKSGSYHAAERYCFWTDECHPVSAVPVLRQYSACGIDTSGFLGKVQYLDNLGNVEQELHPTPKVQTYASPLAWKTLDLQPMNAVDSAIATHRRMELFTTQHVGGASNLQTWTVDPAVIGTILAPPAGLRLDAIKRSGETDLIDLAPGMVLSAEQLGSFKGSILATRVSSLPNPGRVEIAIDVTSDGIELPVAGALVERFAPNHRVVATSKIKSQLSGKGMIQESKAHRGFPLTELHCVFSATMDVELVSVESSARMQVSYKIHGQLVFVSGIADREARIWSHIWAPAEEFLHPDSFLKR